MKSIKMLLLISSISFIVNTQDVDVGRMLRERSKRKALFAQKESLRDMIHNLNTLEKIISECCGSNQILIDGLDLTNTNLSSSCKEKLAELAQMQQKYREELIKTGRS